MGVLVNEMIRVWIILKIQIICLLCKEKSQGSWLYLNRNRNSVQSRSMMMKKKFVKLKVFLKYILQILGDIIANIRTRFFKPSLEKKKPNLRKEKKKKKKKKKK